MRKVDFNNKILTIDNLSLEMDYQIKNVRIINDLAVVIFKYDDNVPKFRQFNNCMAFDANGNWIWTAEHPTSTTSDFYLDFMDSKSNKLWNFGCFVCSLNFKTGKLKSADFTK